MPENLYCFAGWSELTVTVSPTLKPYFLAVPRSIATSPSFCGSPPLSKSSTWKSFSSDFETMRVGGPLETIALPCLSSSRPLEDTEPSATFTPGVALTLSSTDEGIVGACEKSAFTASRDSSSTSTPFWVRSNRFLNDSLIVSVNTSVPTTKATPITTAKPVRTERSLRVSRPRSATDVTSRHRLHQIQDPGRVRARAVVDHA